MPYKEREITKLYYTIGEVAEMFKVNASLIRFWDKEFDQLQPKKNKKGNRLFSPGDVDTIKIIYRLVKEKGYTLPGAREYLKTNHKAEAERLQLIESLTKIKSFLLQLSEEIGHNEQESKE